MNDYNFEYNQESYLELSKEIKLKTAEIHRYNDYYGQASVIKQYAGIPQFYPLKGILEHGIFLDDVVFEFDQIPLPIYLASSQSRASIQEMTTCKKAIPIGFGFLYAKKIHASLSKIKDSDIDRKGTIVFPLHSTPYIKATFDHKDYAKKLSSLPGKFHPVVVSLYYRDIQQGVYNFYEQEGLKSVTCGHRFDALFMIRLYDLCRNFKYSTSNEIGTHLFTSINSGCNFFYTPSGEVLYSGEISGIDLRKLGLAGYTESYKRIRESSFHLFSEFHDSIRPEAVNFVDQLIGTRDSKTRKELRNIIFKAEMFDKFHQSPHTGLFAPPYFLERKVCFAKQLARKIYRKVLSLK